MQNVKCILIGDADVGKTTLANILYNNNIVYNTMSTIGLAYFTRIVKEKYMCQIWDTAGSERFRSLVKIYFRDTHIAFIVFDTNNRSSFSNVAYWYKTLLDNETIKTKIILVGTKTDLPLKVSIEEIEKFVEKNNLLYVQVSIFDPSIISTLTTLLENIVLMVDVVEPKMKPMIVEPIEKRYCCY